MPEREACLACFDSPPFASIDLWIFGTFSSDDLSQTFSLGTISLFVLGILWGVLRYSMRRRGGLGNPRQEQFSFNSALEIFARGLMLASMPLVAVLIFAALQPVWIFHFRDELPLVLVIAAVAMCLLAFRSLVAPFR